MQHQQLRVRSVNDASEWLLPLRADQQQIQVAALKRLVLEQKQQQQVSVESRQQPEGQNGGLKSKQRRRQEDEEEEENKSEANGDGNDNAGDEEDSGDGGGDSYVMFRGQILADMDFFNLNALAASDFFVFAQETAEEDDVEANAERESEEQQSIESERSQRRKRKRSSVTADIGDEDKVQQLVAMGFAAAQVRNVLQQVEHDLARAIALLTGDESAIEMSTASSNGPLDASVRELVRKHPALQVLQPVLSELQALSVQQLAASDVFQALMLLKENVSSDSLALLNSHPTAAIELFRLPPQSLSPAAPGALQTRQRSVESTRNSAAIDLVDDPPGRDEDQNGGGDRAAGGGSEALAAIERVRSDLSCPIGW